MPVDRTSPLPASPPRPDPDCRAAAYGFGAEQAREPLPVAAPVTRFGAGLPRRTPDLERETLAAEYRRGVVDARAGQVARRAGR